MKYFLLGVFLTACIQTRAQTGNLLQAFPLNEVTLENGAFKDAQHTDLRYMLKLAPDRLLAPYLREAGLPKKAGSYSNWENDGLDGHIGGHYLTALAMMYASTGDSEMKARLDYMVDELKRCQDAGGDGYVGGVPGSKELWAAVKNGDLTLFRKKWVPLYNIHKTFAGLRDAYLIAGNQTAKTVFLKYADWFVGLANALSPQKMQEMLAIEHGGINEVLADVYELTGDKKYLNAAYSFSHKNILDPLQKDQDKLNNLHANTQIPKIIGFQRIAALASDSAYHHAAAFFWKTVTENRSVAIGGNSVREHFTPNFSSMFTSEQGPETCNTYNMLKLTSMLFLADPRAGYLDFYERALYNHILSSQHPVNGGFVYFTPMRPGHYRVYSQPETSMWCCVGSGMENHAKYGEMIYSHAKKDLYVNLFIPSRLLWRERGVTLTQKTAFPEAEKTTIIIDESPNESFTIYVRHPWWIKEKTLDIRVNGKSVKTGTESKGYAGITRIWKKGDIVSVMLPMKTTTESLVGGSTFEAVLHGPIVLSAAIGSDKLTGLFADDSRMGHVAFGKQLPLQEMPMFVNEGKVPDVSLIKPVEGKPLTFTAGNLIYPAKYRSLELIPFYKLHDQRYVVYWQRESPAGIDAIKRKMAEEEAVAAALTARTIDVVAAGEQQPEADHFIKSERSQTGVHLDRHWRDTRSYFSYQLNDKKGEAKILRVTYSGGDRNRNFSIFINGKLLSAVSLDGKRGEVLFSTDYPLPDDSKNANGVLEVKFLAGENSIAGGVYEVRLLK